MNKLLCTLGLLLIILPKGQAQTQQFVSSRTESAGIEPYSSGYLRCQPLWGGLQKNASEKNEEKAFLASCDANFTSRKSACTFFAERGWEYIAEGQTDTAAYRFNLAYLLDNQSLDPYWGLGVVCYQRGDNAQATALFRRGMAVDSSNAIFLNDFATLLLAEKDTSSLGEAARCLNRSAELDTTIGITHIKLAKVALIRGQYIQAWASLHKSRILDIGALDLGIVEELLAKHEDPSGFFRRKTE